MPALLRVLAPLLCASCWLPAPAAGQRVRVCGRELAETLATVCQDRGGFNDLSSLYLGGASRAGRGVADDCCRLGCSLHTMQRYCKYDDVIEPPKAHVPAEDEDEHFSLQLLHGLEAWCEDWRPAPRAPPSGDVECACSSSCRASSKSNDLRLEDVVGKVQKPPPSARALDSATRRPFKAGRVQPYFADRPLAVAFLTPPT